MPVAAWLDEWKQRWPEASADEQGVMGRIAREFVYHTRELLAQPTEHVSGPALRQPLARRLNRAFRKDAGKIGAAFAHLGLMLLDLERLRGGLVLRALFSDPAGRPQWS